MRLRLEERVNTYGSHLKQKYGRRVFRAGISTGFDCPHRKEKGGCVFCLPETFTDSEIKTDMSPLEQLELIVPKIKKGCGVDKVLAYFQDNTSTAANPEKLRKIFANALQHSDVIGLIISTRPDAIDEDVLEMLISLQTDICLEIGVQSIHQKSLDLLRRGHSMKEVERAIRLTEEYGVELGIHLILGIPGESLEDMIETVQYFNTKKSVTQLKLHNLIVFEGTELSQFDREILSRIPTYEEYVELLGKIVPYIGKDKVISRFFTSNLARSGSAIDAFPGVKRNWLSRLESHFNECDVFQGANVS